MFICMCVCMYTCACVCVCFVCVFVCVCVLVCLSVSVWYYSIGLYKIITIYNICMSTHTDKLISLYDLHITYLYSQLVWHRNPDPRSRPQFGQIVNILAGNNGYLLGWSDEDKKISDKEAMTLGAPLNTANDLYYDLQLTYMHTQWNY